MKSTERERCCQTSIEDVFGFIPSMIPIRPEIRTLLRPAGSFETKEELYDYVESRRVVPGHVSIVPAGVVTSAMSNRQYGRRYACGGNLVSIIDTGRCMPVSLSGAVRGEVEGLSEGASARMRKYLRCCVSAYKEMVTLTYPEEFPSSGIVVKEHLRRFNQEVRREVERIYGPDELNSHSIFWFLEFQERGAPHFHLFLTRSPDKHWVARTWARIVGSNDSNHKRAGTRTEYLRTGRGGTICYACKYAAKQAQKTVPEEFLNVGRMWGINGVRKVLSAATIVPREVAGQENIEKATKVLIRTLEMMVSGGEAKVIMQETGVVLLTIDDPINQTMIRMLIRSISRACYGEKADNFIDCEVENGS